MGMFDNYLGDLQKDFRRLTNGIENLQTNAQKVVKAIDHVEAKVTELSDEEEVKKKLKQKAALAAQKVVGTDQPPKS